MANIQINPDQVQSVGTQFSTKRDELEGLVSQANTMLNNLFAAFTGARAGAIQNEWQSFQPKLRDAIATLEMTSGFLTRAANDFRDADSRR